MADVLLIDADEGGAAALARALEDAGHAVRASRTGAGGLVSARTRRPDVVLLDSVLPDISGTEVCRSLKADALTRDAFVLFSSTKNTDVDRVAALELGADDYVPKPVSIREIVLRVQAVLRRTISQPAPPSRSGLLSIDRGAHRVFVRGREVRVTALELRLLCALYDGGSRVQSRDTLLRDVWGDGRGVTTRTVDTHIKRLRRKLGDAAPCIRSVRGVGYGFDLADDVA